MKHGSLFSGIGGFDLAADWMGWENVFHCEIAEFPRKILNYYWPQAESYEDIKKTDFTKWCGTVDIISGGFPCQPYSSAGKRLGKEDDRHLWPEMLRVIREVKPQWVVGENVRGLLNWNGGLVFHEVCADLENIGYEVQAFIIPASGINAPHQRERLWIVAKNTLLNGCIFGESNEKRAEDGQQRNISTGSSNGVCLSERFTTHSNDTRTNNGMQFNGEWKENDQQRRGQSQFEHWENGGNGNVAHSNKYGGQKQYRNMEQENGINKGQGNEFICNAIKHSSKDGNAPDTDSRGLEGTVKVRRDCEYVIGENGTSSQTGDVANSDLHGFNECNGNDEINTSERGFNALNDIKQDLLYPNISIEPRQYIGQEREGKFDRSNSGVGIDNWEKFPTQSPVCSGDDGISDRLDGITFSKWRNESIKGYGNAVVPQVVYRIFKTIEYINNLNDAK